MLHIPRIPSITGTSPSDCLVSYPGHLLRWGGGLPFDRSAVGVFYSPNRLGKKISCISWQWFLIAFNIILTLGMMKSRKIKQIPSATKNNVIGQLLNRWKTDHADKSDTRIVPSSSCVSTTVLFHHLYSNKTTWEIKILFL